jgi:hypothetical protein
MTEFKLIIISREDNSGNYRKKVVVFWENYEIYAVKNFYN